MSLFDGGNPSSEDCMDVIDDLLGVLQDLYHTLDTYETLEEFRAVENLQSAIKEALVRYDAFE